MILYGCLETVKPMPRPQKVTEEQLFAATYAVMNRVGPRELTLAAIAQEAGVTAAVIVQRFGSKRGLMLALTRRYYESSADIVTSFARQHRSPLAALRAYGDGVAGMAASPAAFVRSLAYLQEDLSDAEFRRLLAKHGKSTRAGLRRLLDAAVKAGELREGASSARLARTVETVLSGAVMTWAIYQEGTAAAWVRAELDAVLAPYVAAR
jgi:AcrR family transcriptional regulator